MSETVRVNLQSPEEAILTEATRIVSGGGVIVYPTETLYGVGADARSASAIAKVIRAKKRRDNKPILTIIHSVEMLSQLVAEIPSSAEVLVKEFWPGPLTLVFKSRSEIPEELTQGSGTIGVRIPSSTFCLALLQRCNCPLTSTSANISGEPVHRTIEEIKHAVNQEVDLYIDAGELPDSKPSTIVSVVGGKPKLIREGVISFEVLRKFVSDIQK